jgi:ABC-type uncharacterized transport system fused permease/ATPase subunit
MLIPLLTRFRHFLSSRPGQVSLFTLLAALAYKYQNSVKNEKQKKKLQSSPVSSSESKQQRVAVDRVFFNRLSALIPIVMPGVKSKEFLLLALHTGFLVSRTLLSIYVAQLDGRLVKSIVERKLREFILLLCKWMLIALPATYVNSMIAYFENKLALAFRSKLVNHCYDLYMSDEVYYRIGNLDSRLSNPDQCLTEDVAQFSSDLAHLYSHLSKPCLDVVLMTIQLVMLARHRHGSEGVSNLKAPALLTAVVVFGTAFVLRLATPPFGKLIAEQARKYGELRAVHSRVITHAEEIAFYSGHHVEKSVLQRAYNDLIKHTNKIYKIRVPYTMLEGFLLKYLWSALGLAIVAMPAFSMELTGKSDQIQPESAEGVSTRTQDFVTSRGLLASASDAIERIMSSYRLIMELAGRTARITEMLQIFDQVKKGEYEKKQAVESLENGKRTENDWLTSGSTGQVVDSTNGIIEVRNVPIATPNGDLLIKRPGLSFKLEPGMHLLITGPNGCGNSISSALILSLFHIFFS